MPQVFRTHAHWEFLCTCVEMGDIEGDVLLVAQFIHSLPKVFAVTGTPRDVERIITCLKELVAARKLKRPLRIHLLRALLLLCKLQAGIISIQQLEVAVAATDLAVCTHHIVRGITLYYTGMRNLQTWKACRTCPSKPLRGRVLWEYKLV